MSCGMCFECDNCVIYCPQDAVFRVKKDQSTTGRYVDTDYDKCIGCHICADVCPTGYIKMGLENSYPQLVEIWEGESVPISDKASASISFLGFS